MSLCRAEKGSNLVEKSESGLAISDKVIKLYCLGSRIDWLPANSINLLSDDDSEELYKVDKEFLLYLINEYKTKIELYYCDLERQISELGENILSNKTNYTFNDDELNSISNIYVNLNEKKLSWSRGVDFMCNLPDNASEEAVTGSWDYEYSIFNLVYICKTFDWENDILLYTGG